MKKETQDEADFVNMILESTVDTPINEKDVFSPRLAEQKVLPSLKHLHHASPQGPQLRINLSSIEDVQ